MRRRIVSRQLGSHGIDGNAGDGPARGVHEHSRQSDGRTAMAVAMLHDDRDAMTRLHAAGATPARVAPATDLLPRMQTLAATVTKGVPMIKVRDIARSLAWYTALGFTETARYEDDGVVNFGMVAFGRAEIMLNLHGTSGRHDASLWFYTDKVDELYELLKARQLEAAGAALRGDANVTGGIVFEQDIEDMFYGARQFSVRDPDGYELYFIRSAG
jgi:catechol 2,3-dioxygenase-like lactoylglutathione lyase family enzyme